MNLALTEEQEMLRSMASDFLNTKCPKKLVREMEEDEKGYSPELWQEMAELGWMGMVFPEEYGGTGMCFLDLAILLEEMGRACLPGPFFSTVILGGLPILDVGTEEQKQEYLPKIANGEMIFTLALTESSASYDASSIAVKAPLVGDSYSVSGTKLFVPNAHIADYLLYVARTDEQAKPEDGISIFIVDGKSPGITSTALNTVASDKLCEVAFNEVRIPGDKILGELNHGWSEVKRTIERAALAKCCETVGSIQQVLDMTVEYAKERKQFDRPIGSLQIIQHYCSNMAIDIEGAKFAIYQAAWLLSEGLPCTKEIAVAKAWTAEVCKRVFPLTHQIHGAIGLTMDHDLQLYTRRNTAGEVAFGDADFYREIVAQEMGL